MSRQTTVMMMVAVMMVVISTTAWASLHQRTSLWHRDPVTWSPQSRTRGGPGWSGVSGSEGASPTPPPYTTHFFTQYLDHFNMLTSTQTFQQRYLVSTAYYDPTGDAAPIFLYTGNEGDILDFYDNTGFLFEMAEKFNAYVLFIEHRYYGESMPFGSEKAAFSGANLGWLSSEQALADYAVVLRSLKTSVPGLSPDSPVVAFGGSYGGMLSGWMRMKYPGEIAGAIAASAPIWEFIGLNNPEKYCEITTADFAQTSDDGTCASLIHAAFNKFIPQLAAEKGGYETLTSAFSLCNPITSQADIENLYNWISEAIQYMAMTDYPYPADFLQQMPAWPVNVSCAILDKGAGDGTDPVQVLTALSSALGVYWNTTGNQVCNQLNESISHNLAGGDGWNYQACTEMVMPISQNGVNDMFWPAPFNLSEYTAGCQAQFGVTPRPQWVPTLYGGKDITAASNIVFSNGMLDPWLSGGVVSLPGAHDSIKIVIMAHAAHHLDLRWSNPADPADVVAARELEAAQIASWIQPSADPHEHI